MMGAAGLEAAPAAGAAPVDLVTLAAGSAPPPDAAAGEIAYAETFLRKQLVGGVPLFAVRSPRWKYVEPQPDPARARSRQWLYDLASDPRETHNLLAESAGDTAAAHATVADSLARRLRAIVAASAGAVVAGGNEIVPDEATLERLRALGYIR
jgi:arylsulfatase A-like enzyme